MALLLKKIIPFFLLIIILLIVLYLTGGFGGIVPGFSSQGYSGGKLGSEGVICQDSDGGVKPFKFGEIVYGVSSNPSHKNDRCEANGKLTEYYCRGNLIDSKSFECKYGCESGKCLID